MESFELLEKKIGQLVTLTQKLKSENAALSKENTGLKKKLSALEKDVVEGSESIELLKGETEKTKGFVANLIKSIDQLVEGGNQL